MTTWPADLLPPPWADGDRPGLADLLRPLLPGQDAEPVTGRDVVLLLDGLGAQLLEENLALAPTLRSLRGVTSTVRTTFPSTTPCALTTLMVGASPLETGVIGFEVLDGAGGAVQQLVGRPDIDPDRWMPRPNLGERSPRRVLHVGPAKHARSLLTATAYRGWPFVPHQGTSDRVDAVRLAVRRAGEDGLVYVHVADIDHAGHHHGLASDAWREAVAEVDALLATLLRRLPAGTRLTITADHGMVDRDPAAVIDLALVPDIQRRIRAIAGESRALALTAAGDPARLAEDLRELVGDAALVLEREEYLAAGLFGPPGLPVPEHVLPRLPDLQLLCRGRALVDDFSRRPEGAARMIGVHGSLTVREGLVPVVRASTGR